MGTKLVVWGLPQLAIEQNSMYVFQSGTPSATTIDVGPLLAILFPGPGGEEGLKSHAHVFKTLETKCRNGLLFVLFGTGAQGQN